MERSRAYDALGACFETLNDDCDYAAWEQFLADCLAPYAFSEGIDIGCGNGYFTRAMEKRGYRMTGYDVSLPMLNRAKELSAKERLSSEYVLGDMATLCVRRKADFALAINDCVNYLPPEKCKTAFKRVASCLRKGGAFLFDVSSEYKLREKVANTILADDRDDMTYLCFTALKGNAVELDVTLFLREADGRFAVQPLAAPAEHAAKKGLPRFLLVLLAHVVTVKQSAGALSHFRQLRIRGIVQLPRNHSVIFALLHFFQLLCHFIQPIQ